MIILKNDLLKAILYCILYNTKQSCIKNEVQLINCIVEKLQNINLAVMVNNNNIGFAYYELRAYIHYVFIND